MLSTQNELIKKKKKTHTQKKHKKQNKKKNRCYLIWAKLFLDTIDPTLDIYNSMEIGFIDKKMGQLQCKLLEPGVNSLSFLLKHCCMSGDRQGCRVISMQTQTTRGNTKLNRAWTSKRRFDGALLLLYLVVIHLVFKRRLIIMLFYTHQLYTMVSMCCILKHWWNVNMWELEKILKQEMHHPHQALINSGECE